MTFGQRIAEDEVKALSSYFVETDQWRKLIAGDVDVVYGPKGSGKSALYSLLRNRRDDLTAQNILPVAGEKVRGTPVFEGLVAEPPVSEEQFRGLWKLYFLSLLATGFRFIEINNEYSKRLIAAMQGAGLVQPEWSLSRSLKSALDYLKRINSVSGEVKINPTTGTPEGVEAKITLREPSSHEHDLGYNSADALIELADKAYTDVGKKFWIVLDRLDVAFTESPELEANALRALFRVYRDMAGLESISLKIFLRDDIWARITADGFREASHVTKSITITWDSRSLLHLVLRRILANNVVILEYGVDPVQVLTNVEEQEKLFYRIFPRQVELGARKSTTFDWILARTADGSGKTAPRELIHFLTSARDQQLKSLESGGAQPEGELLFERSALQNALPEVSKVRYEQTLCAEHPNLKPWLDKLQGEKTQQSTSSLAKIWRVGETEALNRAEKLADVGFFQKRGSKEQPEFWVPFLYRDALKLVQGPADV